MVLYSTNGYTKRENSTSQFTDAGDERPRERDNHRADPSIGIEKKSRGHTRKIRKTG